ncbi:MAG: ferritin [Rhodothermaceae bacterium]|nr:MAG: ferritin [Rhodothermaceae bacterium]
MKMKKKVQDAINDQIKAEFESAYLYLAMSARFEALNLRGFAHWMRMQWQEEIQHALKFFDFMIRRGGTPELQALAKPEATFDTPKEAFEEVLAHERYITGRIHELYELARKEHDYALQTLLHWFIDEQVEEEEVAQEILDSLQLVEGDGPGLFMLDRELGARQAGDGEDA